MNQDLVESRLQRFQLWVTAMIAFVLVFTVS